MQKFIADQSGASLVEYGLLVGLISVVAIAAITTVGEEVQRLFNAVADKLSNVATT